MSTIEISQHPNSGAIVKPTGFLGRDLFGRYLDAVRSVETCVYEAAHKRQRLKDIERLPELVDALESAGFTVGLDPALAQATIAVAEEAAAERERVLAEMARAEARIAGSGLSPYPYQRDGILWMACRRSGLLGDEMGLGKTVQALLSIPEGHSTVVVCPSSLKANWAAECLRWRPDLTPRVLTGKGSFRWPAGPRELIIINDDVLPEEDELEIPPTDALLIYDEAHRGKGGKKTKRGRNFLALRDAVFASHGRVFLLTGTPLLNKPDELRNVLQLAGLFEEAYGSYPKFRRAFPDYGEPTAEAAEGLRKVCLARRREDVLPDLPSKTWEDVSVNIDATAQSQLDEIAQRLRDAGFEPRKLDRKMLKEPVVFEMISKIRAIAATAKIPAMIEYVDRCEAEGQALVVFSAHRAPIDIMGQREGWATITGDTPSEKRADIVRRFQAGELKGVAGTIKAMGVGLTLTHAHHCLFVDLDWTPAGNAQAEDRLCRIGQENAVQITTLIADHYIDERVCELLTAKKVIIDGSVTEAARGTQSQAADILAELEQREALARKQAEEHRERVEVLRREREAAEAKAREGADLRASLEGVPDGGYALRGKSGHITFWKLDQVADGRWGGWVFLAQQVGPNKIRSGGIRPNNEIVGRDEVSAEKAAAVLKAIAADPLGAAQLYGTELGICGVCGSELTNDESREMGIGPICRQKF